MGSGRPTVLKRHYGGAVVDDYYWPRPELTEPIIDALNAGESASIFGLRRTGKSSELREIENALKRCGRNPIYIDVQGQDRIDPIVGALINAVPMSGPSGKLTSALSGHRVNKAF